MNRRCVTHTNAQWIRITVNDEPLHREYRHQQNVHRNLHKRSYIDDSGQSITLPTDDMPADDTPADDILGRANQRMRRFPPSQLSQQTYRTYRQKNNQRSNDTMDVNHDDSIGKGASNGSFSALQSSANSTHNSRNVTAQQIPQQIPQQILWVRAHTDQRPKALTLLERFNHSGLTVHICKSFEDLDFPTSALRSMLIMLECVDAVEQEMLQQLDSVRSHSKAPLVVLTDNTTLDWSLLALREGADAIFTLNTPDEIILARSNALLRRWTME